MSTSVQKLVHIQYTAEKPCFGILARLTTFDSLRGGSYNRAGSTADLGQRKISRTTLHFSDNTTCLGIIQLLLLRMFQPGDLHRLPWHARTACEPIEQSPAAQLTQ